MTKSANPSPYFLEEPSIQTVPMVFASPHSGRFYPAQFLQQSQLSHLELRRSEDAHVDDLFDFVPALGAPFIKANYARSYVDPNREPMELDATMFEDRLPSNANLNSERVAAGFGTIPRLAFLGKEIYDHKLSFEEESKRLRNVYQPYHQALATLIARTREKFSWAVLIDCHSMPSLKPLQSQRSQVRDSKIKKSVFVEDPDFILGDCYGESCSPLLTSLVEEQISSFGYHTRRNNPYSGGYCTRFYGCPDNNIHALQIEISRQLYWDEERHCLKQDSFIQLREHLRVICKSLVAIDLSDTIASAAE